MKQTMSRYPDADQRCSSLSQAQANRKRKREKELNDGYDDSLTHYHHRPVEARSAIHHNDSIENGAELREVKIENPEPEEYQKVKSFSRSKCSGYGGYNAPFTEEVVQDTAPVTMNDIVSLSPTAAPLQYFNWTPLPRGGT